MSHLLSYIIGVIVGGLCGVLLVLHYGPQHPVATATAPTTTAKPKAPIFCNMFTEYRNGLVTDTLFVKTIVYIK